MYMKAYEVILSGNEVGRKSEEINKEMEALAKKRDKLLEYNVQGQFQIAIFVYEHFDFV